MKEQPGIYRNELVTDGHFTTVPNDWIRDSGLTPQANMLWIYLLSHQIGYELRDGQILSETGFGRKGLRSARTELVEKGWLVLDRMKNPDGSLGTYAYHLQTTRDPLGTVASGTVEGGTVAEGTHLRKPIPKEKTNLKKPKSENTSGSTKRFDEFWNIYPKKADKRTALRAWDKAITRASVDEIVAGAERYRNDPNREERFTKNPATWLNADAWENGPEPSRDEPRKLSNAEKAARLALEMEVRSVPLSVEKAPDVYEVETTTFDWIGRDPE